MKIELLTKQFYYDMKKLDQIIDKNKKAITQLVKEVKDGHGSN